MTSKNPEKPQDPEKPKITKKRLVRLGIALVAVSIASVFYEFVIEAPISLPGSFLTLLLMGVIWIIFGLPLFAFLTWWTLDRRAPMWALIVPLFLVSFCGRILVGGPPTMTDEEAQEMMEQDREILGDDFVEAHKDSYDNSSPYKRKIFPPY